jgi:hypothetical protein
VGYLKNNILFVVSILITSLGYSQTYNYTYTDPCTLNRQSIIVPADGTVAMNYFGSVQTFNQQDFSNGVFDNWVANLSQLNSSSPCQEVTQVIINDANSTAVANTLSVVTNIMSIMGGGMLPPAESINNSSNGNDSESGSDNKKEKKKKKKNKKNKNATSNGNSSTDSASTDKDTSSNSIPEDKTTNTPVQNSQSGNGNSQSNNSSGSNTSSGSKTNTNESNSTKGETNTGDEKNQESSKETNSTSSKTTKNNNSKKSESGEVEVEGSATQSTANSLSNVIDGGSGGGDKKSNKAKKQAGSLIASGDIVVISNTDQTQAGQMRFVGSITHANTRNTRIKGALFTYTSVSNDLSLTFYKSWINPKKTFNLVLANTTMYNFKSNLLNTTTALESFRFGKGKKFTGMAGVNFTYGKLGERTLKNMSSVAGIHRNFKVSPRISTSLLVLGVYSPFTQFYEGKWWDAGVLVVPFSSWDIKITKTFKYNISFTGVYQTSGNFLNYQILTGGKLNF